MLDACFTQKRRRTPGGLNDAKRVHPQSCFLSDETVKKAEELVEKLRPTNGKKKATEPGPSKGKQKARPTEPDSGEDHVEQGMKVPNSVLDSCHESFKAADEKRVKASTQYFADTGLMALVCRHDRVIWMVNMTSAGEKQHYALALIMELLKHLPRKANIGLLYDIACQLERSCRKWGFLGDDLFRFCFALAVFHAYGHEWACQLMYHPRKCPGFGLSDGEGCERTWSKLQIVIAVLRVSGVCLLLVYSVVSKINWCYISSSSAR